MGSVNLDIEITRAKNDLTNKDPKVFFREYFLYSPNWYFSSELGLSEGDQRKRLGELKTLISDATSVSFNNIQIVGSSSLGFSLAPDKKFKLFDEKSDFDIAIISSPLFSEMWRLFRKADEMTRPDVYKHIQKTVYGGYFSEQDILSIQTTRISWEKRFAQVKKAIRNEFEIVHEVNFRLYRSWEDLEDYQVQSIQALRLERLKDGQGVQQKH